MKQVSYTIGGVTFHFDTAEEALGHFHSLTSELRKCPPLLASTLR